jgi:hypothetical protein
VDVLRRTRRNADTISGAAPDVTSGRPAAVRVGARPYQRIGIVESNRQIHGPLRRNAFYPIAQRLQSMTACPANVQDSFQETGFAQKTTKIAAKRSVELQVSLLDSCNTLGHVCFLSTTRKKQDNV